MLSSYSKCRKNTKSKKSKVVKTKNQTVRFMVVKIQDLINNNKLVEY